MALLSVCLGLRVSELLALRWNDVDWLGGMLNVERGIVNQIVDDVKTETSRGPKTLDPELLAILKRWKAESQFDSEGDWMFASPSKLGRLPFSYTGSGESCSVQPESLESGISGRTRLGTPIGRGWTPWVLRLLYSKNS
jgi:hypothetical protein